MNMKEKISEILESNKHCKNRVIYDSMIPDIVDEIITFIYTDSKLAGAYIELAKLYSDEAQARRLTSLKEYEKELI